jgi:hypothetical protein
LVRKWLEINSSVELGCIFDYTGDQRYQAYRSYWDITTAERARFVEARTPLLRAYDAEFGTSVVERYTQHGETDHMHDEERGEIPAHNQFTPNPPPRI